MIYPKKWRIELYKTAGGECPVLKFIQSLSPKQKIRIEKEIDLLELYGVCLPYSYKRKIRGDRYKNLFELRIRCGKVNSGLFIFYMRKICLF